jgi:hypothetical protein
VNSEGDFVMSLAVTGDKRIGQRCQLLPPEHPASLNLLRRGNEDLKDSVITPSPMQDVHQSIGAQKPHIHADDAQYNWSNMQAGGTTSAAMADVNS